MQIIVKKWGKSLGIRIPSSYAKDLDLKNGSEVEVIEEQGRIIIEPKKANLETLISRINADNLHRAIETGSSLGNEAW